MIDPAITTPDDAAPGEWTEEEAIEGALRFARRLDGEDAPEDAPAPAAESTPEPAAAEEPVEEEPEPDPAAPEEDAIDLAGMFSRFRARAPEQMPDEERQVLADAVQQLDEEPVPALAPEAPRSPMRWGGALDRMHRAVSHLFRAVDEHGVEIAPRTGGALAVRAPVAVAPVEPAALGAVEPGALAMAATAATLPEGAREATGTDAVLDLLAAEARPLNRAEKITIGVSLGAGVVASVIDGIASMRREREAEQAEAAGLAAEEKREQARREARELVEADRAKRDAEERRSEDARAREDRQRERDAEAARERERQRERDEERRERGIREGIRLDDGDAEYAAPPQRVEVVVSRPHRRTARAIPRTAPAAPAPRPVAPRAKRAQAIAKRGFTTPVPPPRKK